MGKIVRSSPLSLGQCFFQIVWRCLWKFCSGFIRTLVGVELTLEQQTPLVFYALSLDAMNDALMEEAARFPGQILSILSFRGGRVILFYSFSFFFVIQR